MSTGITQAEHNAAFVEGRNDAKNDRGSVGNDAHAIAEAIIVGCLAIAAAIRTLGKE